MNHNEEMKKMEDHEGQMYISFDNLEAIDDRHYREYMRTPREDVEKIGLPEMRNWFFRTEGWFADDDTVIRTYNNRLKPVEEPELTYADHLEGKANQVVSDGGGGQNYYDLPPNCNQLLDLIEHRNMNGNIKDIFKACYRLGEKEGTSEEYDLRKMVLYSLRELGRVTGRRDYIDLAIEVAGHHDRIYANTH